MRLLTLLVATLSLPVRISAEEPPPTRASLPRPAQPSRSESQTKQISLTDRIPYGRPPIDYFGQQSDDAVARLQKKIDAGDLTLESGPSGYLRSVLQALDVPASSQLLVYSKTARVPALVTPRTPRAVYFNDEVTVAWIPTSRELELTAIDPVKGANFYTLSQPLTESGSDTESAEEASLLRFERRDRCLACHAGQSSLEIPGLLLRAFQTDRTGQPLFGFSRMTHDMTYNRRWGGWYVTGAPGQLIHRGNLLSRVHNDEHKRNPGFRAVLSDITASVDLAKHAYVTDSSDVIAHMVFAHQMHGLNLLIRVGMEARLGRRSDAEDHLIRYLVFADEPPLPSAIDHTNSPFARWFEAQGTVDTDGRSLRRLDLKTRLLRHRLSWLIDHAFFRSLPGPTRAVVLTRLWNGLTSTEAPEAFHHLMPNEKTAIIAIVRRTVPDLPSFWTP